MYYLNGLLISNEIFSDKSSFCRIQHECIEFNCKSKPLTAIGFMEIPEHKINRMFNLCFSEENFPPLILYSQ